MADEIIATETSNGEAIGHLIAESEESVKTERDGAASGRAKNKTVMLGGSFAQQIREKLGFDKEGESEDGFVTVRASGNGALRTVRQANPQPISQTKPVQRNVEIQAEQIAESQDAPTYNSAARAVRKDLSPIVGFIVSYDRHASGEVYELRLGRWIVSSAATMSDNFLVIEDESISQNHATLRIKSGTDIQLIDQFSENGTGVTRSGQTEEEGVTIGSVGHGDVIRLGHRSFHVSIVNKS